MRDFNIADLQHAVRELTREAREKGYDCHRVLAGGRITVIVGCVMRHTSRCAGLTTTARFYVNGKRIPRALLEACIAAGHL